MHPHARPPSRPATPRPIPGSRSFQHRVAIAALAIAGIIPASWERAPADDWPQFLGPERNGTTTETVRLPWPAEGPTRHWSVSVGSGFAGPAVSGHRVLLHHRQNDAETLDCLDAERGSPPLWRHSQTATYRDDFGFDNGPRAVPTIRSNRVVTLGADGRLTCVNLADGRLRWTIDTARDWGARKGFFGFASSPAVVDDLVLANIGGTDGGGIVAVGLEDGVLRWKSGRDEAGYASPILITHRGERCVVFLHREGVAGLDPATGRPRFERRFRARAHASVNAATPLYLPGGTPRLFLTASYGAGAEMLDLSAKEPNPLWKQDDRLSSHYASVVHHDGVLFGYHGRQEEGPELRAVDAATGRVLWQQAGLGAGTVTLAGRHLLVLTERGELVVAAASGRAFEVLGRTQFLGSGTRAHPAVSNGRLFARDSRQLVCLPLGPRLP